MKVALVHDYLKEYGGAEMVLEDLHEIFPDAPIYTFFYDPKGLGLHQQRIKHWDIRTSFMQKFPFTNSLLSALRIFGPMVFEGFDLSSYEIVISSSNIHSAKAVITKPETLHLSYIHTPPKMLYGLTTSFNYKKHWFLRIPAEIINHFMRLLDFEISQRPDILIANSKNTQARIKKFYRRNSVVIHPGVDIKKYSKVRKSSGEYFLSLNRLVRGKGTEIVIASCTKLNLPLKVAGDGPEFIKLKKIAGPTIEFLGAVSEAEKIKLYSGAKALITCTEQEDFGITPLESMAAGTPVIAANSGGYLETVIPSKTGELFDVPANLGEKDYIDQTAVKNLIAVLEKFDSEKYQESDCRHQAEKFSKERFKKEILDLIDKNYPVKI